MFTVVLMSPALCCLPMLTEQGTKAHIWNNMFTFWYDASLSFLWRFSGFSLFWYLPLVANIKIWKSRTNIREGSDKYYAWGKFNKVRARRQSLYWCQAFYTFLIKVGTRTTSAHKRLHCWTRLWISLYFLFTMVLIDSIFRARYE